MTGAPVDCRSKTEEISLRYQNNVRVQEKAQKVAIFEAQMQGADMEGVSLRQVNLLDGRDIVATDSQK